MRHTCERCAELEETIIQLRKVVAGSVVDACEVPHACAAERKIYNLLRANMGKDVKRDRLRYASRPDFSIADCESSVLSVHICRLRKKMREVQSPYRIVTVWGFGFRLERKPERVASKTNC